MEIFSYLEKATGVENLSEKPWAEVVNNVILPKLAGRAEYRNRIYPEFMKFLALYADTVCRKDNYLGEIMLEIAMQRISNDNIFAVEVVNPIDSHYIFLTRLNAVFTLNATASGKLVEVQGTAEGEPFSRARLNELLDLAEHGLRQIFEIQRQAVEAAREGARS